MNLLDKLVFDAEFTRLHTEHSTRMAVIEENRTLRKNLVDVEAMRSAGELQPGETFVGVRVIDQNISREVPTYLQFIKGARRMGIFQPIKQAQLPVEQLEVAITTVLQYPDWELDYIRWIDGGLLHGYDFVEIVYDTTKPGHVAVNHIGADNLLCSLQGESLEQSPIVGRGYSVSVVDLDAYVAAETFTNAEAVNNLRAYVEQQQGSTQTAFCTVYKCLFKVGGVVHSVWYSRDVNAQLSEPIPYMNGTTRVETTQVLVPDTMESVPQTQVVDVPETEYPFVMFSPSITEEKKISAQYGHAVKSEYVQDSISGLTSAGINGCRAASLTQWAPAEGGAYQAGGVAKQVDTEMKQGKIWDRPMKPWTAPWPDPTLFRALDHLDTGNSAANNQISWAVNNRQDSRKTATEIQSANQTSSQISSVQMLYLSIPLRKVVTKAYTIIKGCVQKGRLDFGIPAELFAADYIIKSAGDIDYVQRQERVASMQQDWPIVANTGAAQVFLSDYLRERYPATAQRYIEAMAQPNDTGLIQGLAAMLQQAVTDENGQLRPEWLSQQAALGQLAQAVQQRVAGNMGSVGAPGGNANGPQPPAGPAQ